jgi:hypothetical protein
LFSPFADLKCELQKLAGRLSGLGRAGGDLYMLSSILVGQQQSACRPVCFSDNPELFAYSCRVAAQQSKAVRHAVLVLCDIRSIEFAAIPSP